jgi:hypothetical protein
MMVKLAEAVGRVVLVGKDLNRLAGLTAMCTQLISVLKDLNTGTYHRSMIRPSGEYNIFILVFFFNLKIKNININKVLRSNIQFG